MQAWRSYRVPRFFEIAISGYWLYLWLINLNTSYPILSNTCKIGKNWIALHLNISH